MVSWSIALTLLLWLGVKLSLFIALPIPVTIKYSQFRVCGIISTAMRCTRKKWGSLHEKFLTLHSDRERLLFFTITTYWHPAVRSLCGFCYDWGSWRYGISTFICSGLNMRGQWQGGKSTALASCERFHRTLCKVKPWGRYLPEKSVRVKGA